MAITITVDNNRTNNTPNFTSDPLLEDESSGAQITGTTTDDGNEFDITLAAGDLLAGGISAFNSLLNGGTILGQAGLALTLAQKNYAVLNDGASSNSDFIKVDVTAGETINDLFFAGANGQPLNGTQVFISPGVPLQTLTGDNVYLYSSGDFAIATTGPALNTAGARVVAAFYLDDSTANHLTAGVQMVTFEALKHPDANNVDEPINWTDALRVGASGSVSFNFDSLDSGANLWVAVGTPSGGVLVSGENLAVDGDTKITNESDKIHVSQGGEGTTIGENNQLFDVVGETAVFTLVTGMNVLSADGGAQGVYLVDQKPQDNKPEGIDYSGYINSTGAGIFISQSQGNDLKDFDISLFRAGGVNGTNAESGSAYLGTGPSGAFDDDIPVNVATVTVKNAANQTVAVWSTAPSGTQVGSGQTVGGVTVTISGNNIDVNGVDDLYTVSWTSAGGALFNRFQLKHEAGQFDVGRVDVVQTIPGGAAVGDKLFVEDDAPGLSGTTVTKAVGEDAMTGAGGGDLSTGNPDAGDTKTDEVSYTYAQIASIVNVGTDSPAITSLVSSFAANTPVKDVDGNNVTSKGETVFWGVSGGVVQGITATNRVVFTITNDSANSEYDVDLKDQIDHANASGDEANRTLNLTPAFKITDKDLDPATLTGNLVKLDVENDVPILSGQNATIQVDEDEMAGAGAGDASTGVTDNDEPDDETNFTYADLAAVVTAGADEPVTFSLDLDGSINGTAVKDIDGNAMTSKGVAITWNVNGNIIEGKAGSQVVFTLTRNTQNTASPTDDTFTFDLKDQIDHPNASGDNGLENLDVTPAFNAVDFDGDAVDLNGVNDNLRPIRVNVENDVPVLSGQNATIQVDEDEMAGAGAGDASTGITDNDEPDDETDFTYAALAAVVTAGADEPVTISLDLDGSINGTAVKDIDGNAMTSKGVAITWNVNGNVVEGKAGSQVVFTLTRNTQNTASPTDDTFTFDLKDQIDHPNASGDNGLENLDVTPAFNAVDFDGDAVDLNGPNDNLAPIRVNVENDVPILSGQNATIQVDEDEMAGAGAGDASTGNTDNDELDDETDFTYAQLAAVVTPGADEPVAFSLDLDGSINGTAVKDVNGNAVLSKGTAITWNVNGSTVEGKAGSQVVFTLTRDTKGTATPTDDTFTFDLKDQIDHADASGDNALKGIDVTAAFNATDFDGDAVDLNGVNDDLRPIRVNVENDVPTAKANATVSKEVHEDALATGNTPDAGDAETKVVSRTYTKADLDGLANIGADEDLTFSLNTAAAGQAGAIIGTNVVTTGDVAILSKGVNVKWAAGDTAGSLKGIITVSGVNTTIFTLVPSGNDFVFTLVDQIDHSGAENDQEVLPLDLTSAFKAVDFDKDPLTLNPDSIIMNVENDLPKFSAQIASDTIDWVDETSTSSTLNGKVGADDPASYVIDKYTDLDGYTETLSNGGKTLSYIKDGKTFFLLELSDTANNGAGGYTFTVKEPPPPQFIEFNFDNLASGNFLWVAVGGVTPGGTSTTGLLCTGSRLNLNADGTAVSGGKLASDQVNTSQGGAGATIGIDNQMFTPGDSGIFTFVKDYVPLTGLTQATGQDIDQIAYTGYANVNSGSLFISQKQGNTKLDLTMSILEAGTGSNGNGAQVDEEGATYASGGNISGSGNNAVLNKSLTFLDDYKPNLLSVDIRDASNALVGTWTTNAAAANASAVDKIFLTGATVGGIQVTITNNSADINGVDAFYSIQLNAVAGETFNRIELQADTGKFDIGKFVLNEGQDTPDIDLAFSVSIEDKDADLYRGLDTTLDDFKIKVDGTGQFNDPLNIDPSPFVTSYDLI